MKKLVFLFLLITGITVHAQDTEALKAHYLKMYRQGIAYNDINTAISALHGYIALDNGVAYRDTLSMLYFTNRAYYSSLVLAEEVCKAAPENVFAKARAAECYDELGDPKTATNLFEQVVAKTKNPYHFYKLAITQYQLKRTGECEASARAVIADTSSKRIGVNFASADGSQQTVPIHAAAANLLGVLNMDAKNYAAAKLDFERALQLFPQFAGARNNLESAEKNLRDSTKPPTNKPKTN